MKPYLHPLTAALLAAGLFTSGGARADEPGINYKVSGFGTLALTSTSVHNLEFRTSMNQSIGANNQPDLGVDSRLGLQGVVNFSPELSLTGQMLAQRRRVDTSDTSNRDFDPGIEWLMVKYSPQSNLDLRMGRVVLPAFMISDSRNVGYAQPWLRAPLDVYEQMPLTTLDGVQATWRIPVGDATVSLQPSLGKSAYNVSAGVNTAAGGPKNLLLMANDAHVFSLNGSVEYGNWVARMGQTRGTTPKLSLDVLGVGVPVVFDLKDVFTNLGLQYDDGKALVMAEVAVRRMNDLPSAGPAAYSGIQVGGGLTLEDVYAGTVGGKPLARTQSWYLAGGWHFGKFLPMVMIGQTKDQNSNPQPTTNSLSASLRYDLVSNVAVKAQVGRYDSRSAAFVMPTIDTDKRTVTVASFGLDFVF